MLASLDAESLFSNVPVQDTIQILLDNVYNHETLCPPKIPRHILEKMLSVCTKEAPFRCPSGKLYCQIDGVAMGSPLGVLFSQAYMCHIENSVLQNFDPKPHIYVRYVDDILVDITDEAQIEDLKKKMEENSCLRFTVEKSVENRIPFLDVLVDGSDSKFTTSVYRKPINPGRCLNGASECPKKYKLSVIRAYIHRAFKVCSNWPLLHQELTRVRQILTNNGYSMTDVDKEIERSMNKFHSEPTNSNDTKKKINIYYQNTMSSAHKKDEKVLRDIVYRNCKTRNAEDELNLIIYYRNPRTSSLVMKNNLAANRDKLKQSYVVYKYSCTHNKDGELCNNEYIGYTTQSLSQRLTYHMQQGAIKTHLRRTHNINISRQDLNTNTVIIARSNNTTKLKCLEAVLIREIQPEINIQQNMCGSLELFKASHGVPRRT